MADRTYVLGTHDAEVRRLGIQHRVWRPHSMNAWQRAGITQGHWVLDVGAGPGYATLDLAEIVGPTGRVVALERSGRFATVTAERAERAGLDNVEVRVADVTEADLGEGEFDASWCRWLLSFVSAPEQVIASTARSLKPGGVAVFHEYVDYRAWRMMPPEPALERFVDLTMRSWRDAGGEPDIGLKLPMLLEQAGMEILCLRPIVKVIAPKDYFWKWPAAFLENGIARLFELEVWSADEAASARRSIGSAKAAPGVRMITPIVLEVIARRE